MSLLGSTGELRLFASLLNESSIAGTVNGLTDLTVLAPTNAAIEEFLDSQGAAEYTSSADALGAFLSYHLLPGTTYITLGETVEAFLATYLSNKTYSNVTGGQIVEAYVVNGNATVVSGLLTKGVIVTAVSIAEAITALR
jgi:uncharacterized surface protein with fasciclin (FAS1) repeats